MDRSRERNLVGRIRTCALTGTSRWDGLRAALPSPVPLWRNRAMPGMPARQRGPCRGCHARKATGAMPVVPSRHRRMPSRHRGHTGDDSRHRGAPSRHRGHALGAAYLNEFGHARLASVTACDRGAVGSARGGSTAVPSVGRTASCGAWLGTIKAAPPAMARPSRKITHHFLASSTSLRRKVARRPRGRG